ncbi:hypothetical protein Tco_0516423 [Tanacetum coccineum]
MDLRTIRVSVKIFKLQIKKTTDAPIIKDWVSDCDEDDSEVMFWQTVTVNTVNDGEQQLTITVDGQTIAITEASVRRHL